jgi:transposase
MPLLALWSSNPNAIGQFTIEQIVAAAGSGDLRDNSDCAQELREYLSQVTSQKLAEYVERCLSAHFSKSGGVLQDLINELGRRLDYKVTNGRYQGTINLIASSLFPVGGVTRR